MYRSHPPDRTSLPPLPLSETTVLCPAGISTAPLRGGRLYRMHSEMHTHSYPTAPDAMAATPTWRSASAPHHRARCKSAFSLRPEAQATDTAKYGCNGMALPCVLMGAPRPELRESLQTDKHGLQKLNGIIFRHVDVQHEAQVSVFWERECAKTPSLAPTKRKEADSGQEATMAI